MKYIIDGIQYYPAKDVAKKLNITHNLLRQRKYKAETFGITLGIIGPGNTAYYSNKDIERLSMTSSDLINKYSL